MAKKSHYRRRKKNKSHRLKFGRDNGRPVQIIEIPDHLFNVFYRTNGHDVFDSIHAFRDRYIGEYRGRTNNGGHRIAVTDPDAARQMRTIIEDYRHGNAFGIRKRNGKSTYNFGRDNSVQITIPNNVFSLYYRVDNNNNEIIDDLGNVIGRYLHEVNGGHRVLVYHPVIAEMVRTIINSYRPRNNI